MSTAAMEELNIKVEKFELGEKTVFQKEKCKKYIDMQEKKIKSTPASPNCFRAQGVPRHKESPVIRLALFPRLEKCVSEPEVWSEESARGVTSGSKSEGHISDFGDHQGEDEEVEKKQEEKTDDADDIEDVTKKKSMLSESQRVEGPGEALILPRKLQNPCLDSRDHQNLHRELLFNQKIGKNVLNQKSELQRALEKHKESQIKRDLEVQKQDNRTPLEKVIEERARRLESLEKGGNIEEEPSNKPEFLQVHAKLRAKMDSK